MTSSHTIEQIYVVPKNVYSKEAVTGFLNLKYIKDKWKYKGAS